MRTSILPKLTPQSNCDDQDEVWGVNKDLKENGRYCEKAWVSVCNQINNVPPRVH